MMYRSLKSYLRSLQAGSRRGNTWVLSSLRHPPEAGKRLWYVFDVASGLLLRRPGEEEKESAIRP